MSEREFKVGQLVRTGRFVSGYPHEFYNQLAVITSCKDTGDFEEDGTRYVIGAKLLATGEGVTLFESEVCDEGG